MAEDFVLVGNLDDIAENESKAFDITGRVFWCAIRRTVFSPWRIAALINCTPLKAERYGVAISSAPYTASGLI